MDGEPGTGADNETLPGGVFTRGELRQMIRQMETASNGFYSQATRIHHHAFIEFTGLMNEYIKLCKASLERGVDFTLTNVHSRGAALPMEDYHRAYLEEKLDCIYGVSLDDLLASKGSLPQQIMALCAYRARQHRIVRRAALVVGGLLRAVRGRFVKTAEP